MAKGRNNQAHSRCHTRECVSNTDMGLKASVVSEATISRQKCQQSLSVLLNNNISEIPPRDNRYTDKENDVIEHYRTMVFIPCFRKNNKKVIILAVLGCPNYHSAEHERHGPEITACTPSIDSATAVYTAPLIEQAVDCVKLQGACPSKFAAFCLFVGSQDCSFPV